MVIVAFHHIHCVSPLWILPATWPTAFNLIPLHASLLFTHLIFPHTHSVSIMDFVQDFAREHVAQISATIALVTYAVSRNKLTPAGVLSGVVVAIIHMLHPWQAFFWLLMVFFLLGTLVTKVRT